MVPALEVPIGLVMEKHTAHMGGYKHITGDATSFHDKGTNFLGKGDKSG